MTSNAAPHVVCFLEGRNVPASRFRVLPFVASLAADRTRVTLLYTRPSKYLSYPAWVRRTPLVYPWAGAQLLWIILTRLVQILMYARQATCVVLQRDLLYRVPVPFLERFLFWWAKGGKRRFVLDIDDALFVNSDGSPAPKLAAKMREVASHCDTVIAGNTFLATFFAPHPDVRVIPTVIDLAAYPCRQPIQPAAEPTVGWIGTAANVRYLEPLVPVLTELAKRHRFRVVLVCEASAANPFTNAPFPSEMREWNASRELADLHSFDIGLMPVPDTDWGRGKCGFKLLQYMAVGIPAVASSVGANREIASSGRDAILAATPAEWQAALEQLLQNPERRGAIGQAARTTVEERYALTGWLRAWERVVTGRDEP